MLLLHFLVPEISCYLIQFHEGFFGSLCKLFNIHRISSSFSIFVTVQHPGHSGRSAPFVVLNNSILCNLILLYHGLLALSIIEC